jgi:hypothetical protein
MAQGTYPPLLASGFDNLGRFDQFDLYAGESDIVSSHAQAADGQAITQFQIVSFDVNGRLVPWDASEFGYASGTLTFTGQPVAAETVTINGVVLTFRAAYAAPGDVVIGATFADTAANLAAVINGTPDGTDINTNMPTYGTAPLAGIGVTATRAAGVVTLHAIAPGTAGNAITLTEAATNVAASAATLTGGAAESDIAPKRPAGIAAQPAAAATPGTWFPYFTGGVFNHEALVWPDSVATLAQRKRAFAGSNIGVDQLL